MAIKTLVCLSLVIQGNMFYSVNVSDSQKLFILEC